MKTLILPFLSLLVSPVWSIYDNCPCGYTTETGDVWVEVQETDFTTVKDLFYVEHGWDVQEYNVSAQPNGGVPYARSASRDNLIYGSGGLQLLVRPLNNGVVSGSEISTSRNDILYGSFRVGLKTTTVNGTCGAFFWFYDDSSEIDVELLSRQYSGTNSLGNFVIHSPQSTADNFNAALTPTFINQPLGFDPTTDFHEYRFDWTPSSVTFFLDGTPIDKMTLNIPTNPGTLFINHWSNGSPDWTAGPPSQNASITVLYMKSYFNSSDQSTSQLAQTRCQAATGASKGKTCPIPSLVSSSAGTALGPPPSDASASASGSVAPAFSSATYTIPVGSTNLPSAGAVPFLSANLSNVVDEDLWNNTYTGPGSTKSTASIRRLPRLSEFNPLWLFSGLSLLLFL